MGELGSVPFLAREKVAQGASSLAGSCGLMGPPAHCAMEGSRLLTVDFNQLEECYVMESWGGVRAGHPAYVESAVLDSFTSSGLTGAISRISPGIPYHRRQLVRKPRYDPRSPEPSPHGVTSAYSAPLISKRIRTT